VNAKTPGELDHSDNHLKRIATLMIEFWSNRNENWNERCAQLIFISFKLLK